MSHLHILVLKPLLATCDWVTPHKCSEKPGTEIKCEPLKGGALGAPLWCDIGLGLRPGCLRYGEMWAFPLPTPRWPWRKWCSFTTDPPCEEGSRVSCCLADRNKNCISGCLFCDLQATYWCWNHCLFLPCPSCRSVRWLLTRPGGPFELFPLSGKRTGVFHF